MQPTNKFRLVKQQWFEPDTEEIDYAWEQHQEAAFGEWKDIEVVEE